MAFNFPDSPTEGQIFTDAASGAQYVFRNGVWMQSSAAQIKLGALEPNIVVNPRFSVSQEHATNVQTTSNQYAADQWQGVFVVNAGNPNYSVQTLTTDDWNLPEATPVSYAKLTHGGTPTPAPATTNSYRLQQPIERSRARVLGWFQPTVANRKAAVLRFAAKVDNVSAPVTFSATLRDDTTSVSWIGEFTVQPADTGKWKLYQAVIPAPSGGTWGGAEADSGLHLGFTLMAGSTIKAPAVGWNTGNFVAGPNQTNMIAVAAVNALYLANVGLYVDPENTGKAPPFLGNNYAYDLAECQRYWQKDFTDALIFGGAAQGSGTWYADVQYPVTMRAIPSVAVSGGAGSNVNSPAFSQAGIYGFRWFIIAQAAGSFFIVVRHISNARM